MLDPLGLELHVVKLPCGFWVPNSNPLQKQPVLVTTELSDQPLNRGFLISSLSLSLFILIQSHVAQDIFTLCQRIALRSSCLHLTNAGITGQCHHA